MHTLQACLYITVSAFCVYALRGEDDGKRAGWRHKIVMEIALLIIETHGKIMEL